MARSDRDRAFAFAVDLLLDRPELDFDTAAARAEETGLRLDGRTFDRAADEAARRGEAAGGAGEGTAANADPEPPDRPADSPADPPAADEPPDRADWLATALAADSGPNEVAVRFRPAIQGSALRSWADRLVEAARSAGVEDACVSGEESAADGSECVVYFDADDLVALEAALCAGLEASPDAAAARARVRRV